MMSTRLALLVLLALPATSSAQRADGTGPTMTSLDDLGKFLSNPDYKVFPVDFTATVTYFDWERRKLFVQGEREAIFIAGPRLPEEQRYRIGFGTRLRVVGKLPTHRSVVTSATLSLLDGKASVKPLVVDGAKLRKGAYWSRYVQLQGELVRVVQSNQDAQLVIRHGETKTICTVPGATRFAPSWAIGSQIQVEGVLDWETHPSGAPKHSLCHATSRNKVKIIAEPTKRNEDPIALDAVRQLQGTEVDTRVTVRGTVSFLCRREGFLLEDDRDAVFVRYEGSKLFSLGDHLEIDGTVLQTEPDVEISLNVANRIDAGANPPLPARTTARQVIADNKYNRRVMLSGKIIHVRSSKHDREVLVDCSGFQFRLRFWAKDAQFRSLKLIENSQLVCSGLIRRASSEDDVWFTCESHPTDIWSQHGPYFVDRRFAAILAACTLGVALASGLWLFTMRIQVKRKTRHLADVTAQLRASHQSTHEGVLVLDMDGRVANVNSKFGSISGLQLRVHERLDDLSSQLASGFVSSDRTPNLPDRLGIDDLSEPFRTEVVCQETGVARSSTPLRFGMTRARRSVVCSRCRMLHARRNWRGTCCSRKRWRRSGVSPAASPTTSITCCR